MVGSPAVFTRVPDGHRLALEQLAQPASVGAEGERDLVLRVAPRARCAPCARRRITACSAAISRSARDRGRRFRLGKRAITSERGASLGRGTRCQSSSVMKGMKGCSRPERCLDRVARTLRVSRARRRAPSALRGPNTGLVSSRYQSQSSFQKKR
jgi:hypothetical protein